jgi:hypothetical protein
MTKIVVAKQFSKYPAGRYRGEGPFPAEALRDDTLIPALNKGRVTVDLSGAYCCASFLEELFGGLYRAGFAKLALYERLSIVGGHEQECWRYIAEASRGEP